MVLRFTLVLILSSAAFAQQQTSLAERVADTAFIQIESPSFDQLDAKQKALAYYLNQASIAIDPIIYDQLSQYGVREKRVIEEIMSHTTGIAPAQLAKIRQYALLFWANRGNHNENTGQKFLPTFMFDELKAAVLQAQTAGAFKSGYADLPPLAAPDALGGELDALRPSLFDAAI